MKVVLVTQKGVDVASATPEQCVIHSSYPPMNIEEKNSGNFSYTFSADIPANTSQVVLTVPHGYTYVPASYCLMELETELGSGEKLITTLPFYLSFGANGGFEAYCDATNFYILHLNPNGYDLPNDGSVWNFRYHVFVDDGQ